jgi:hypothetical protein
MHYLLKLKILQFVFKCFFYTAPTCFGPKFRSKRVQILFENILFHFTGQCFTNIKYGLQLYTVLTIIYHIWNNLPLGPSITLARFTRN